MKGRCQVYRDDAVPLFGRKLLDGRHMLDTGVVDENVHTAELLYRFCDQCAALVGLRHVGRNIDHADAMFLAELACEGMILLTVGERVDHDVVSCRRQRMGYTEADPGIRSGDDCGLAGRCSIHA